MSNTSKTDFDTLILTDEEETIFNKFLTSDTAELTKAEFNILSNTGLIKNVINGKSSWFDGLPDSGTCKISEYGKRYRKYLQACNKSSLSEKRRLVWAEIRAWLTLAIAVAAFIKSFFVL